MSQKWTIERAAKEKPPLLHPLDGANFTTLCGHYFSNLPYERRSLIQRLFTFATLLARFPFYQFERLWWRRAIEQKIIAEDPIFIIGHWRSGTTHLHNLLSQDPQFAWLNFAQTGLPWDMLGKKVVVAHSIMNKFIPETRGMDNVSLSLDSPQEEEMALSSLNRISYYNCYYFPRKLRHYFNEAILFEGVSQARLDKLAKAYRLLVKKLNYANDGKRLLLKNPCCTSRMLFLKSIFPGAKFVHIIRNPYEVFASSHARFGRVMSAFAWQKFDDLDYDTITLENYRLLMRRFLEHREKIDPADFHEIRYEDLTSDPLREIEKIYDSFSLPGKETALKKIAEYIDAHKEYSRNVHVLNRSQVDRVARNWDFALNEWGYDFPETLQVEE